MQIAQFLKRGEGSQRGGKGRNSVHNTHNSVLTRPEGLWMTWLTVENIPPGG